MIFDQQFFILILLFSVYGSHLSMWIQVGHEKRPNVCKLSELSPKSEDENMKKAAIYVRVSTHEQTVEQQIYPCQKWCQLNEYEYELFAEEGVSGAKTSRTKLDLMLQRMRKGEFDAIVVWKLDRLGRNTQHLLQLSEEFRNKRVKLVCVTQNIDTERPEGRMFFTIIASFAELEREFTMERIKLAMATKKLKGIRIGRPKGCKDKKPRRKSGYLLYHANNPHKGDSYYKRERREQLKREAEQRQRDELPGPSPLEDKVN